MKKFLLLLATFLILGSYINYTAFKRGYEEAKFDQYKANQKLRQCLMVIMGDRT